MDEVLSVSNYLDDDSWGEMMRAVRWFDHPRCVAVLFAVATVALSGCSRPSASEVELASYDSVCTGRTYDENCKGKYVNWSGTVDDSGKDYVRVKFGDVVTMDVQGLTANDLGLVKSQKVRVSGWLADRNFMYPDITDGEVEAIESINDVQVRIAKEQAARAFEQAKERSEAKEYWDRVDNELAHCKLADPSYGQGDQSGVRDCLSRRMQ